MKKKEKSTQINVAKCNNDAEKITVRNNRADFIARFNLLLLFQFILINIFDETLRNITAKIMDNSRKQRLNPLASEDVLPVRNLNLAIQPSPFPSFPSYDLEMECKIWKFNHVEYTDESF